MSRRSRVASWCRDVVVERPFSCCSSPANGGNIPSYISLGHALFVRARERNVNTSIIHSKSGGRSRSSRGCYGVLRNEIRSGALSSLWSRRNLTRRRRNGRSSRSFGSPSCSDLVSVSLPLLPFPSLCLCVVNPRYGSMQPRYARTSRTRPRMPWHALALRRCFAATESLRPFLPPW